MGISWTLTQLEKRIDAAREELAALEKERAQLLKVWELERRVDKKEADT